MKMIKGN